MRLVISKNSIANIVSYIRRSGYGVVLDRQSGGVKSYVRRLHGDQYPRFHLYVEDRGEEWSFNLHLDQRAPIYPGVKAHSGEYEGAVVEREMERIAQHVNSTTAQHNNSKTSDFRPRTSVTTED